VIVASECSRSWQAWASRSLRTVSVKFCPLARWKVAVVFVRSAGRLRYETWRALHLSMYLAVAPSSVHQLAGPDLAGGPVLQVA
jgi:hypothetical protein